MSGGAPNQNQWQQPQGNPNVPPLGPSPIIVNQEFYYGVLQAFLNGQYYPNTPQQVPIMNVVPMQQYGPPLNINYPQQPMQQNQQIQQSHQMHQYVQPIKHNVPTMPMQQAPPMQQYLPQMTQQWPYGQPPTASTAQSFEWPVLPDVPLGHLAQSLHTPQSLWQSVEELAETTQQPHLSPQTQWNVAAKEFIPLSVKTGTPSPSLEVSQCSRELAEQASPSIQAVISLEADAQASASSVPVAEKTENVQERDMMPKEPESELMVTDRIGTEMNVLTLEATVEPNKATSPTPIEPSCKPQEFVQDVTPLVEKESSATTNTSEKAVVKVKILESQQKKAKKLKEKQKAVEKSAKDRKKKEEDEAALEEAFAENSERNAEKMKINDSLIKYIKEEKTRRDKFQKNDQTLPKGTAIKWITMDSYLFCKTYHETVHELVGKTYEQLMDTWMGVAKGPGDWTPYFRAIKENEDDTIHVDMIYLAQMLKKFPHYGEFLHQELMDSIFNMTSDAEDEPDRVVVHGMELNSTIVSYLLRHTARRLSNKKNDDKLDATEVATIVAYKKNPWTGMSILEARKFFSMRGKFYWAHWNRKEDPQVQRNAMVFHFLSTIPSPILAFDASFCFDPIPNPVSDSKYVRLVMGDDEVPPLE